MIETNMRVQRFSSINQRSELIKPFLANYICCVCIRVAHLGSVLFFFGSMLCLLIYRSLKKKKQRRLWRLCSEKRRRRLSLRQIKTTVTTTLNKAKRHRHRQNDDDGRVARVREKCRWGERSRWNFKRQLSQLTSTVTATLFHSCSDSFNGYDSGHVL